MCMCVHIEGVREGGEKKNRAGSDSVLLLAPGNQDLQCDLKPGYHDPGMRLSLTSRSTGELPVSNPTMPLLPHTHIAVLGQLDSVGVLSWRVCVEHCGMWD